MLRKHEFWKKEARSLMKTIFLSIIRFYQRFVSPLKPPSCRFYPTCSQYGYESIRRFGALRGGYLALRRILRCHPLHPGGYDPVPEQWPGFRLRKKDS